MKKEELENIERMALHRSAIISPQVVLNLVEEVRRLQENRRASFAAMAMQGLISWSAQYLGGSSLDITYKTCGDNKIFAKAAVDFSDALIAELEKGGAK